MRFGARRQREETDEAGRVRMIVMAVVTERGEARVVERERGRPSGDDGIALVQLEANRTGDPLLRAVDERIEGLTFRRPPAALVHQIRVARGDLILQRERAPVERDLLQLTVCRVEQRAARRLVDAA